MLLVFLTALVAFIAIILFLVWYSKFVANQIFGKMNAQLSGILDFGKAPDEWYKRLRKIEGSSLDVGKKAKALQKYNKYVEASYKDIYSYAEKTSFIEDDARNDILSALERFMDDYRGSLSR